MSNINNPTSLPTLLGTVSHGVYVGNAAANRAIPHSLGVIPRIVFIIDVSAGLMFQKLGVDLIQYAPVMTWVATTISDAVNFYVGDAGDTVPYANVTARNYTWVALGEG